MADQTGNGRAKKTLEDLSREELIEKCNGFLHMAKKAKVAKDGELSRN
jgi:hypothetical protein